ncbi:hypothetical protein JTB14_026161 [Gonioctena quinquepunctata]|nr:hypothetical protein JTB14_026161 [Gonioctena quinquepunctata]
MEGSQCTITITNSPLLEEYTKTLVTIGDSDGELWRSLDIAISTMNVGEKANFSLDINSNKMSLVIELVGLVFNGFIYEWGASKKYNLALHHKEKGNQFYNSKNNKEAAFRYSKALKILHSIPLDVEDNRLTCVDDIPIDYINKLKCNLYNNLSSCFFRTERWERVTELCNKVLMFDCNNIKALYKIGVACENDRNFEKAWEIFNKVIKMDPGNQACIEHLAVVKEELRNAENKMNDIMKKMFSASMNTNN